MSRHLLSCTDKETMTNGIPDKQEEIYEIHITDQYQKAYWLFIEINGSETLLSLDQFLRDIWCECCGHLSEFYINGSHFSCISDSFYAESDMNVSISDVLYDGLKFKYEYDLGSSTDLVLTVKSVKRGKAIEDGIRLLARNNMPEEKCSVCRKRKAAYINTFVSTYDECSYVESVVNYLMRESWIWILILMAFFLCVTPLEWVFAHTQEKAMSGIEVI